MNKLFIAIVILVVSASALFSMTEAETKEAYVLFNSGSYRDLTRHLDEIKGKDAEYYKLRGLGCLYDTQYKDSAKVSRICREKLLTDYKTDTGIYPFCVLIDLMNGSMSDLTETLDTLSKQKPGGTDDYLLAVYYLLSHLDTIPGVRIEEKDRLTINSRLDNDALFDFAKGRIPYRQDMSGIGIIVSGLNMDDYDEEHWAKLTKSNLTSRDFTLARILVKDVSSFINKILVYERLMDMYADNRLLQNDCKDAIYSYTEEQMSDGAAKNLTQYYQTHIDRVDKLIAKYPDNKVIKTLKADFLYLSGRYEECIELCKSVESNDPDACILIVLSALANGDTSKQETYNAKLGKIYEKTFEDYKRSYRLLYYILACNEKRKGSIDGTFGYYDKCIGCMDRINDAVMIAKIRDDEASIMREQGTKYYSTGNWLAASQWFLRLEKFVTPLGGTLAYNEYGFIGHCYAGLGDYYTAITYYRKAIDTAPEGAVVDEYTESLKNCNDLLTQQIYGNDDEDADEKDPKEEKDEKSKKKK